MLRSLAARSDILGFFGAEAWEGVAGSGEFDAEKREYIITAGRRYAAGDQVLLCYGRYYIPLSL